MICRRPPASAWPHTRAVCGLVRVVSDVEEKRGLLVQALLVCLAVLRGGRVWKHGALPRGPRARLRPVDQLPFAMNDGLDPVHCPRSVSSSECHAGARKGALAPRRKERGHTDATRLQHVRGGFILVGDASDLAECGEPVCNVNVAVDHLTARRHRQRAASDERGDAHAPFEVGALHAAQGPVRPLRQVVHRARNDLPPVVRQVDEQRIWPHRSPLERRDSVLEHPVGKRDERVRLRETRVVVPCGPVQVHEGRQHLRPWARGVHRLHRDKEEERLRRVGAVPDRLSYGALEPIHGEGTIPADGGLGIALQIDARACPG
eukprot:scaffold113971_cov57-Phaeocystis_antarctica.AAC.3